MLEISQEKTSFWEHLEEAFKQQSRSNPSIQRLKETAWQQLSFATLPSESEEGFHHFPLETVYETRLNSKSAPASRLLAESVEQLTPEKARGSQAVFLNGYFSKELSDFSQLPKEAWIGSLDEAALPFQGFLKSSWQKEVKDESAFSLWNKALFSGGLFLYLPANLRIQKPIHILRIVDTSAGPLIAKSRLHIVLGKNAEANLSMSHSIRGDLDYASSFQTDITQDEGSLLTFNSIDTAATAPIWEYEGLFASLKRNARLKSCFLTRGGHASRKEARIRLAGEGSEADLSGLWALKNTHHVTTSILMHHDAPHTRSFQFFKGILDEASTSMFTGKIYVESEALKTDAFQLNNNLLLSPKARTYSEPQLEIFADDVKASHGATVGSVNDDALFYLRTRGFTKEEAESLLTESFGKEVIEKLPSVDFIQKAALAFLKNYLNDRAVNARG